MTARSQGRGRVLASLVLLAALATSGLATAAESIDVSSKPIARFGKDSASGRYGDLDFVGGFEFWSRDGRLKGVSAIRLQGGGERFLSVTDTGNWFAGRIERDAAGRPTGLGDAVIAPLLGPDGQPMRGKIAADAESLSIDGDRVFVGFERDHRIYVYENPRAPFGEAAREIPLPLPRHELRTNRGIETIATAPARTPLAGARVAIAERSIDTDGNLFAAIFDGSRNGVFKIRKDADWDASDGAFLPGGDLLLLERRYRGFFGGLGIRIRRIAGTSIRPGALVDGPVIMEADLSNEIDNMEGLDVWIGEDGDTRLTLVSDDNGSIFQRNLLLEFRLVDRPAPIN
ncbi:esterase-like activity of phytase family protein [Aurantimonas marianensis]|uniref:Esterase-like activity of phytase family protein n=1 Tax=Aurantimonas marianensis TaxID=2920428 RepID=A0A9X2H713_9HYPH|nr:esterase-like activity of phytase family protein [Aurantimonas marianensis]MCP3056880.1 esterase-like activity of phytase family protein [Aurantimonas marianensis]